MTDAGPAFTFLSVEDVLSLHEDAINTWGGSHGIRDRGLFESAVAAATNVALYDEAANIYDIAAAYAYHVAQNQPFLDGNKRTGLAAAAAFLFINGVDLQDRDEDGESVLATAVIRLAERRSSEPRRELADVLRRLCDRSTLPESTIRLAGPSELDVLSDIDDDACRLYEEAGLTVGLSAEDAFIVDERARWLASAQRSRVFLAVDRSDRGVAFAALGEADGLPYLEQLSVRSGWMRRGLGRQLLRLAVDWARRQGAGALWLTTWSHLPYNRPFYESEGFEVVPEPQCGPGVLNHLAEQRRCLPAPEHRVAMRLQLSLG